MEFLASIGMAMLLRAHRERPAGCAVRIVVDNPVVLRPLQHREGGTTVTMIWRARDGQG